MDVSIFGKTFSLQLEGNRAIFLLCMSMASLFWFFTKMGNKYITHRVVKVDYLIPREKAFSKLPEERLTLYMEGTGWNLLYDYLFITTSTITIDLSKEDAPYLEQASLLNLLIDRNMESRGLEIKKTIPPALVLKYEPRITKKIPIQLRKKISLAKGHFMTGAIQLSTDSVAISGARSVLDTIAFWPTEWIELAEIENTIEQELKLSNYLARRVFLDKTTTDITIPVEEFTQNNVIADITMKNAPDTLDFFPKHVQIFYSLPMSKSGSLHKEDFEVEADLKNAVIGGESSDLPIVLTTIPTGIRAVKYEPKAIRFWLVERDTINQDSLVISSE